MRRRRRSRPRLITICRGPIIPLTCSFKLKFSALIPEAHDRAQLKSLTSTHKAPDQRWRPKPLAEGQRLGALQPNFYSAHLKSIGPIPKAHDRAQLNLSLATFTEFQLETNYVTTCSAEPCTDAEGS